MNFDPQASLWNMPELGWSLGYPMVLGLMLAMASGMLVYFWRKGWFRSTARSTRDISPFFVYAK